MLKGQRGQVGLVVLLVTVVLLTVGVSVASRSVTELQLSRQEQESTRALNLAESGIENLLAQDLVSFGPTGTVNVNGETIPYTITKMNEIEAQDLESGHTIEVTLDGAEPSVNGLEISWTGDADPCEAAIMEVMVMPETGNQIKRNVYSDCPATVGDDYNVADVTYAGGSYRVEVPISLLTDVSVRIKPLVTKTQVSVRGVGGNLGTQVYQVRTMTTLEDGTTRAVRVNKLALTAPSIFDYVLFSGNALEKTP